MWTKIQGDFDMDNKCILRDFFVSKANEIAPNIVGEDLNTDRGSFAFNFLLNADAEVLSRITSLAQASWNKDKVLELWFYRQTDPSTPPEALPEDADYSDYSDCKVRIGEAASYIRESQAPPIYYLTVIFECQ